MSAMEKSIAQYLLDEIKARVLVHGRSAFTNAAVRGIDAMGLTEDDAIVVVLGLKREMLFKSMTTHADHRVWQDVYHARCPNGKTAYIKVTIQAGATVIQFKEK